jgi:hypothetical protein
MYFNDVYVTLDDVHPRHAAWYVVGKDSNFRTPVVTRVNLPTGESRMLLNPGRASTRPSTAPRDRRRVAGFSVLGFTSGGDSLVYEWQDDLLAVSTAGNADEPPSLLARKPPGFDYVRHDLSPDRRRVIATASRYDPQGGPAAKTHLTIQAWDGGRAVTIYEGDDSVGAQWLDDERLLLTSRNRVIVLKADGSGRRVIFESGSKEDDAAGPAPK